MAETEVETRIALHDLIVTYARGADRADEVTMRAAFQDGATMETGLATAEIDAYVTEMVGNTRATFQTMYHSVSNERFEIAGDHARGECYLFAYALGTGDPATEIMAGGRYLDRFERRSGNWKFASRLYVEDWRRERTVPGRSKQSHGPVRGGFLPEDPSRAFWAAPFGPGSAA